ncbi:trans-sulfuration enzyme family protein [Gynurincola endophyticus]|jgi:cystathionine beta-lyase/cystathionine gamma-synthase|uniref:trans-sulfuration enzyme family protein n=1 Tax=Gynurincola endophyticus TaxID=2479004 RepID=UPI000F8EEB9C|nr:PLP-dependent aspartate aminotransferase family protein [Gynurincola endophyticus]
MDQSISYIINELGEERSMYYNAVAPPIIQTSNFAFNKISDLSAVFEDEYSAYLYSRGLNPTVDILRKKLAALDGAEDCLVLNSGASAIYNSVMANVKTGDHIISVNNPYSWAKHLFNHILPRFGVNTTYIDGTRIENFEETIQPNTTIIYLESPNGWSGEVQDLAAIATLAKKKGIVTICDNSFSTPLYQQPVKLGIDISIQSATKYIGGHSDVVAGVLSGTKEMIKKIFESEMLCTGNVISPQNAWLLIRGLRTLPMRLERVEKTAQSVRTYLESHSLIEKVIYPFSIENPQHLLAKKQMKGVGGLFSFVLNVNSDEEIVIFCESLRHILIAVSWGGHESLVMPSCASLPKGSFDKNNLQHKMVRMYVGLEEDSYLIADISQALDKITAARTK